MNYASIRRDEYMYSYSKAKPEHLNTHYHDYYEFIYIVSGDLSYIVENSTYKVSSGDIFFTKPEELHTLSFKSDSIYERHFIQISRRWLSIMDFDFVSVLEQHKTGENNQIPSELTKKYELEKFFSHIQYYVINQMPESDIMIKTYILQFLVKIIEIYQKEIKILEQPHTTKTVSEIKKYINAHYLDGLTLDDIAKHFYLSKYYLCHTFKNETGLTIKEFINTKRIARARLLLPDHGNSSTLYAECGFNDYSTFYKTFKRFTGVSPKEFLK